MADFKETLLAANIPAAQVSKIMTYINTAKREEAAKEKKPVSNNSPEQLISLVKKYWDMGIAIDGVNAVITGRNMAMVTFHGYKNKVLQVYPETEFDLGLVRDGDTFRLSKDSGRVNYHHEVYDPFGSQPIIGAYIVFKNKRGEYIETLHQKDFESMKNASKQKYLWEQWDSEFWLKSVTKRAFKRHFYDVVAEIDKEDNEVYGIADKDEAETGQVTEAENRIAKAKDEDELTDIVTSLPANIQKAVTQVAADKFKSFTEASDEPAA